MKAFRVLMAAMIGLVLGGCSNRGAETAALRECAEASAFELGLLKDRSNFPGEKDSAVQKSGTEAWTAANRWKQKACASLSGE
jgi:hypothetical protein